MPKQKREEIEEESNEEESRYIVESMPTETIPVIKDKETGKRYDSMGSLRKILEEINELRKIAEE